MAWRLTPKDDGLLDEVTGLVEWPVVLMGTIERQFMDLPPEVLTTSMRTHQKYFVAASTATASCATASSSSPTMIADDGGKAIVAGNERVLRARLSDAKFFWDQDRKQTLESRLPSAEGLVFHAKLGTRPTRSSAIAKLAGAIAGKIPAPMPTQGRARPRASPRPISSTGMVGEFPELQGIMGRYYALQDEGEPADVADAIAEHYSPLGPNDRCPTAPVSSRWRWPTRSTRWSVSSRSARSRPARRIPSRCAARRSASSASSSRTSCAFARCARLVRQASSQRFGDEPIVDLLDFFADRLKVQLRDQGVRHDLIAAVFARGRRGRSGAAARAGSRRCRRSSAPRTAPIC